MKSSPCRIIWLLGLVALTFGIILLFGCARPNNYPVITSLGAQRDWVAPSSSCEVKCVASDANSDRLTYVWSATGGGFSGTGPITNWVAPSTPGTYAITVAVTDGRGGEAKKQLTLGVRVNHSPVIKSLTAKPRRVVKANTSVIECIASDLDEDALTYLWTATGGNISGRSATATWTSPNREGSYIIRVIVTDSMGRGDSKELQVTVTCCGGSQ